MIIDDGKLKTDDEVKKEYDSARNREESCIIYDAFDQEELEIFIEQLGI